MKPAQAGRRLAAGAVVLAGSLVAVGIVLSETALRLPARQRHSAPDVRAVQFAGRHRATWRSAEIAGADGAKLRGWLFVPERGNGSAAVVLHGVADSRAGVLGHAALLLEAGYVVLAPDSRGHGESGGDVFTFGVLERGDMGRWVEWLRRETRAERIVGLGESMGAAILLQSADSFQAVVAECSFSTFREVARYRVGQKTGLPGWLVSVPVEAAFIAARVRHGVDLGQASPLTSTRRTRTPVLLIHGEADTNIPPQHSQDLSAAGQGVRSFWLVAGASHTGALATCPEEFQRRVLGWFSPERASGR